MSFMSDYKAALKKLKKEEEEVDSKGSSSKKTSVASNTSEGSFMEKYRSELSKLEAAKEEEEDIAPALPVLTRSKKKEEEEDERKWFQKGLFEDGYDFGDISRTILGTTTDVLENLGAGIIGMGEKAIDAMAYIAPAASQAQFVQNGGYYNLEQQKAFEESQKALKKYVSEFISKDLYDEEKVAKKIILGTDENSVLGEKSDALVQSAGQLGATIGLQAVGVPWFVTSGVTSFGSETESAFNEEASYEEAGLSAAITAGAEILTEKISGGIKFGGKALDDVLTKQIARGVSNKTIRTLAKLGLDAFGEGAEEILSGVMSAIGQKITYADDAELTELFSSEDALESFIGGAVLGGGFGGINAVKSNAKGVDYVTELTANEQKVVDKVYKDTIAELEKTGKVTERQKAKVYDDVLEQMEKGYISTDTIEEVLGGDSYKVYKDTVDSEDSILKEFEELGKKQNATLAEQHRYAELSQQVKDIKANNVRSGLKSQLGEDVFSLVQGDRLVESYNEKARKSQAFEADLSQYDEKQKQTIQNAINSGTLNNARRTHEMVDFIAKISADKGVLFDFTNNEKIKGTQFAVEGKTVNGYVTDSGVTLNVESPKYLGTTVGHEITHVLEGTEMYDALKQTIFDYAKSKGEYDSRMADLTELYKDIEGADIEAELTADLVGEYLFRDKEFVNRLSTENRNIFQKIYDEIKYLCRVATAGSKEARELEKVRKAFEDAYRAESEETRESETQYSVTVTDKDTIDFLDNQEHIVTYKAMQLIDGKLYPPMAAKVKDANGRYQLTNPSQLGVWQQATEDPANIKKFKGDVGYYTLNKGDGSSVDAAYNPYEHSSNLVLNDQFESAHRRDNLVTVQGIIPVSEMSSGYKAQYAKDTTGVMDWHSGVVASKLADNKRQVYLSRWFKPVRILPDSEVAAKYKEVLDGSGVPVPFNVVTPALLKELENAGVEIDYDGTPMYQYHAKKAAEKAKYSISDSDGKQLTKEQQEYFKDSKMRDENGNLKVMYHGSQDAGFHVFDPKMSDDDTSFFFVDRNDVAASYSGTTETYEAKTIRSAEDMNNFLAEIGYDHYEAVEKDGRFELLENNDHVAWSDTAQGLYEEFCWYEGVGEGDANYKVYLNLKNPLEVDAEGRNWNNISREYSHEVADRYHSLTAEEKAALHDLAEWGEYGVFKDEMLDARAAGNSILANAYEKLGGANANLYDAFSIASENFSEEAISQFAAKQMNTRDYAQKAKAEGYDGVIFKNIVDVGGYGGDSTPATVAIAFESNQIKSTANVKPTGNADIRYSVSDAQNEKGLDAKSEISFSLSNDTAYADNAIALNQTTKKVAGSVMDDAKALRGRIAARMNDIKDRGLVGLPEDIAGNTYIANSSYDGTEENTTICPRSLASEAFTDAVSEYLGRPLTVEEQIYISQDLQGRSLTPECTYCYVATDRKAYRAFLGEYVAQRDAVLQKVQANPAADVSRSGELYKEFLNGRKDTNPMYSRFKMWVDAYKTGKPMIDASHLANINKLMGDINSEFGAELKPQIVDAMKYAQSASWAKKRVNYVAYNGHILKWKQDRINKLNSHYGLRMYSFSDFHPAFVLENMQMITDASVRGLKMLGYTKDTDFVEIFAPSGMNINVSTFGFESGGNVYENNLIGAEWEKAKALREQYPNVGVTFVATNDTLVDWALQQDWIDVVIPYHLVRTGAEVAKAFGYTNYTSESSDTKTKEWARGDKKYIAPTEHNNNKATYLAALEKNHLKPRFERFIDNPNYMKLVNECRQPASESKPVQPVFNEDAAMVALAKLEANGYYQPIGGSVDRMYEIAAEVAEDMTHQLAPAMSLSEIGEQQRRYGTFDVPANEMMLQKEVAPTEVVENNVQDVTKNATVLPDDLAPMAEEEANAQQSRNIETLGDANVPPENEPYYGEDAPVAPKDPFEDRDFKGVGKRDVNAYMYDNPEVKPFFQMQAQAMLGDLQNSVKGEKWYNDDVYYASNGEDGWGGTRRQTTDDIAYLLDMGYTYAQIEKGLNAIIEDNGAENIAMAKRIEFALNDRLSKGYTDINGVEIPANQDYLNLLAQKEAAEAIESQASVDDIAPVMTAPVEYEAIRPKRERSTEPKMVRADSRGKRRKWVGTSTKSEAVDGKVLPKDLNQELIHYQPIPNKKTLGNANAKLNSMGYEASVAYLNSQFSNNKVTLDDIALGERLIQEAVKKGDTKTAGDLIMDISILGTELGQKVQALSIIKRLTPEGQLRMLQRTVERGKTKGDKAFEGVEVTQDMVDKILKTRKKDGSYDQKELNKVVEDVKQEIADNMPVTMMDKVNAWRYLSMLGNPKTHIRNLVSNVAMNGTVAVKNVVARTIESIAPIQNRTKTWKAASEDVKKFAQQTSVEMQDIISGDTKYSESASIKEKRQIFKNKILNGVYEFNSDMLGKEDWWFSKPAFTSSLSEYLTANGINTEADIQNNPKTVEKAKQYALEQAQIATFRQYSWLANKINEIERKNNATDIAVGAILPFKKTPINIAKTGLNYSPLGFAKTLTYDVSQVKNGKMEASELVDHLAQNITGSALTLVGYMLAKAGFLNGAGDDDKEGNYDYQLGKQAYSVNIGGATYSLSWLSPVAMPLFVGANAYEQLVEGMEWNGDVVVETLAQTLDPLSEMSFISSLDSVLSSYDSGLQKFAGIGETMVQNYVSQFVPTLSSQIATVTDDTKRTTKVGADSEFKFFDETINSLKYKIPGLRQTLEPSTDIWGNEIKQTENVLTRAFETFLAPYAKREDIGTEIDEEIKSLYRQTGDNGLIPAVPYNYTNYDGVKYEMSAREFTEYKKNYGQTAASMMEDLFNTNTYQNADSETRAEMVNKVYDYARDEAKRKYLKKQGVTFTNATEEGVEYYRPNAIKGAIENDMSLDEYTFYRDYPEKHKFLKENNVAYAEYQAFDEDTKDAYNWAFENPKKYEVSKVISSDFMTFYQYKTDISNFDAKDENGESVSGLKKERVTNYINGLNLDYGQKLILFKSYYDSKADKEECVYEIVDYLNNRADISYEEMETILKEIGYEVDSQGNIYWD